MSDEATMLGNLVPPFIEWKGKRYDLRYKVQRVKAHYQNVIKAKKRKEVAELAETLPEEGRTKFLLEAVDKLNKENITDDEWLLFMGSTEGLYENVRAFVVGLEKADDETILEFLSDCQTEFEIALKTITTSMERSLARSEGRDPKAKIAGFRKDGIL